METAYHAAGTVRRDPCRTLFYGARRRRRATDSGGGKGGSGPAPCQCLESDHRSHRLVDQREIRRSARLLGWPEAVEQEGDCDFRAGLFSCRTAQGHRAGRRVMDGPRHVRGGDQHGPFPNSRRPVETRALHGLRRTAGEGNVRATHGVFESDPARGEPVRKTGHSVPLQGDGASPRGTRSGGRRGRRGTDAASRNRNTTLAARRRC